MKVEALVADKVCGSGTNDSLHRSCTGRPDPLYDKSNLETKAAIYQPIDFTYDAGQRPRPVSARQGSRSMATAASALPTAT
jgi:hypothetical protein